MGGAGFDFETATVLIAAGTTWAFGRGLSGMVGSGKPHP